MLIEIIRVYKVDLSVTKDEQWFIFLIIGG